MQARSVILAACVALAEGACQTNPSDDDAMAGTRPDASAAVDPNRNTADLDETLHDRVHDALMVQMGPKANDIGVIMHGTTAHLTGHVHSEAAHGVSGVTAIDISALSVQP